MYQQETVVRDRTNKQALNTQDMISGDPKSLLNAAVDNNSTLVDLFSASDATAELICKTIPPVTAEMTCFEVVKHLKNSLDVSILPIVLEGIPLGLIKRKDLIFSLKHADKHKIKDEPISSQIQKNPVVVEKQTLLIDLVKELVDDVEYNSADYFIITENGYYLGIASFDDLIHHIARYKQSQLYNLAFYDQLTGLGNRIQFNDRLQAAITSTLRHNDQGAVLFIDLDGFKAVNDNYGHDAGDILLKAVAGRLKQVTREGDTVARLSGDEFSVILTGIQSQQAISGIVEKLLTLIKSPVIYNGNNLSVSASIGVAFYPYDSKNVETLINMADSAMYRAKRKGKNSYQLFSTSLNKRVRQRMALSHQLSTALKENRLKVYYQSIFDRSGSVVEGFEALLRWHHPKKGILDPIHFLPVVEDSGLMDQFFRWMFKTVCNDLKSLKASYKKQIKISINLALEQINLKFVDELVELCSINGVEPSSFTIEVAEPKLTVNRDLATIFFMRLKKNGFSICVDRFGTGQLSMTVLQQLNIDEIKIDKTLTHDLNDSSEMKELTHAILVMAHALNISVIGSGVETAEQQAYLQKKGCDRLQGYHLNRPLPIHKLNRQ